MPYLYQSYPPQYIIDAAASAVKAAIDDAARLGLVWRIIPASVVGRGMADPMATRVVLDGDTDSGRAVSMVGALRSGQRVWCVQVPPAGLYVMGIIGPNVATPTTTVFTASGTWTKPTGLAFADITGCGGGGAGGGAAITGAGETSMGAGGGGAATARIRLTTAQLPATVTVTRGAGGTGVAGGNGNAGGTTSFGALLTIPGGSPGAFRGASAVAHGVEAGNGGTTLGGTLVALAIVHSGTAGSTGWGSSNALGISGSGGASHLGGGGRGRRTTSSGQSLAGLAGLSYGGGGGGSINAASVATAIAGAAGANGILFVEEYY